MQQPRPQPKVHPGAAQAMNAGVGGLHRPMPKPAQPSPGPVLKPAIARNPMLAGDHAQAGPQPVAPPNLMLRQLLHQLPPPQVTSPGGDIAARLAQLRLLMGGR